MLDWSGVISINLDTAGGGTNLVGVGFKVCAHDSDGSGTLTAGKVNAYVLARTTSRT